MQDSFFGYFEKFPNYLITLCKLFINNFEMFCRFIRLSYTFSQEINRVSDRCHGISKFMSNIRRNLSNASESLLFTHLVLQVDQFLISVNFCLHFCLYFLVGFIKIFCSLDDPVFHIFITGNKLFVCIPDGIQHLIENDCKFSKLVITQFFRTDQEVVIQRYFLRNFNKLNQRFG